MPQTKVREGHRATAAWLRALEMTAPISKNPERTFPILFDELGEMFGDSCALLGDDGRLSLAALSARANQYARWAIDQGLRKGDVVCLHLANRIEYLAVWLGITRVGGVVALSNTNLAGQSLAYCVNSVRPKHVIVGSGLADQVSKIKPLIACRGLWSIGEADSDFPRIDHEIERYAGCRLSGAECRAVTLDDLALFVYTSGTTGLPKAARIPHRRIMQWSHWFAGLIDVQPRDRMYDCLPLYHSVGGIVATGAVLIKGGSVVIRQKFSAQRFWEDVAKWDCTLFQYIGELCRYLVQAPSHPQEKAHRLRLCCGNGLRSDVWTAFQERFGIPKILEFYAATEGNVSLYNLDGRPGSIGRVPSFLKHRSNLALARLDTDTNQLLRGDAGFCIPCKPNEAGEAIGRIDGASPESRFEGYHDAADDAPKIVRDVFETGDAWFRTGDLLRMDGDGYFYFVDRIATPSAGRGRTSRRPRCRRRCWTTREWSTRPSTGSRCPDMTGASAWRLWSSTGRSPGRACRTISTAACRAMRIRRSFASARPSERRRPSSSRRRTWPPKDTAQVPSARTRSTSTTRANGLSSGSTRAATNAFGGAPFAFETHAAAGRAPAAPPEGAGEAAPYPSDRAWAAMMAIPSTV